MNISQFVEYHERVLALLKEVAQTNSCSFGFAIAFIPTGTLNIVILGGTVGEPKEIREGFSFPISTVAAEELARAFFSNSRCDSARLHVDHIGDRYGACVIGGTSQMIDDLATRNVLDIFPS